MFKNRGIGNSTGHREPHNQTPFACTAPGAGQHRDWRYRHPYLVLPYVTSNDTSKNTIGGALWESY